MNCHDAKELLHAYLDGELDLVRNLDMEQHVQACPSCSVALTNARALKSAIAGGALYFNSPPQLRRSVLAAIVDQAPPAAGNLWWKNWRLWTALGFACVAVTASTLYLASRPTPNDRLLAGIRAGHVRSVMTRHLTDIASGDRAVVQPWFEGKLDFIPNVAELSGCSLVGGRLDFVDDRPMAALVYERDKQLLSVFVWRMSCEDEVPEKAASKDGLNLAQWSHNGIAYALVSDLKPEVLQDLASRLKK